MTVARLASELPKIVVGQSWSSGLLLATPSQNSRSRGNAIGGLVAGDQRAIDGADRGADDPIRLDAAFHERLVDAGLIGAERAAALQDQHHLLLDDTLLGRSCRRLREMRWTG